MLTTVEGVYRNGQVQLTENPENVPEETQVIVTFLPVDGVNLMAHGIDRAQAAELRTRLSTFAADWDAPEMDGYNNFNAACAFVL